MRISASLVSIVCVLGACGKLNNLDVKDAIGQACVQRFPIQIELPFTPGATVGMPWAGWLVAKSPEAGTVAWHAEGLPEGLTLNSGSGLLSGRPVQLGDYEFSVTATLFMLGCPPIEHTRTVNFSVIEQLQAEQVPPDRCDQIERAKVTAFVWDPIHREPKSEFSGDGLTVIESNLLLTSDADSSQGATHRMLLSNPQSLTDKQVEVRYAIPGGVHLPLKGATVDLRYFSGKFGDRYFFLTHNGHPRFVVYNGYLDAFEIMSRCPNSFGFHCVVPLYSPVATPCDIAPDCGPRRALALAVEELKQGLSPETVTLLPGNAVEQTNNTLFRLVDSWEWDSELSCDPTYPLLFRHGFYVLPLGKEECTYAEAYVGGGFSNIVPVSSKALPLVGRLMHPGLGFVPQYSWFVEPPTGPGVVVSNGEYVFDEAGDYIITLVATAILEEKQIGIYPCGAIPQAGNISAQIRVTAVPEVQ